MYLHQSRFHFAGQHDLHRANSFLVVFLPFFSSEKFALQIVSTVLHDKIDKHMGLAMIEHKNKEMHHKVDLVRMEGNCD